MKKIIVSRHPAAVEFVAERLGGFVDGGRVVIRHEPLNVNVFDVDVNGNPFPSAPDEVIPVVALATAEDVRGAVVYGNIPLHLAASAAHVWAIEFDGAPPRGTEYGVEEMKSAGARLRRYKVEAT